MATYYYFSDGTYAIGTGDNEMANFTDDHKTEAGKYFQEGVHKVKIVSVTSDINENNKEYIEFFVEGSNGEEDSVRTWLTTDKAIKYTFNTIRGIFVHNALEGKEDAARDMVNKVTNSEELVALCNKVLAGKEAFLTVEKSDYTYTNAAGEEKHGYNKNLTGYEPKPKETKPNALEGAVNLNADEVPDVF
jgi:hypothetical protein